MLLLRTPSPSSEPPARKYEWFSLTQNDLPYTSPGGWIVVVGVGGLRLGSTGGISIKDVKGNQIDAFTWQVITGAGAMNTGMPRRMLVPDGGIITDNDGSSTSVSCIRCQTLEDALAIL